MSKSMNVMFCHPGQFFVIMPVVSRYTDVEYKRAATELWKAEVPQRTIKKQLSMSETKSDEGFRWEREINEL